MSRPLFRARTLDPNKRIRLLVDQHDDNNNDLTNPTSTQSSSSNLLVSYSSTSNLQTSQHSTVSNSQLPQRCVPQMPFVSGMEREEEAEYHLQNALDAQQRLGSAKICAVPIPDVYEDKNSQSIYPATIELPKQLIRLQPLQLESDDPEYDMDKADHEWFKDCARSKCPDLTCLEYETIIDKFENASTRILISFDEAKTLLPTIDESCLKLVHEFWHQRRTMRNKRLKLRLLTERDVKEEKGKHHPYVAFRRRVEKMTTRKNRKNDEQAYMSMLKLRSNFEAVVKLTNLIKVREATKLSLLECALSIFKARCEAKPGDEATATTLSNSTSTSLPTNHDRNSSHHVRSNLKPSLLMNSTNNLTPGEQHLLTKLLRLENHKKNSMPTSSLAALLQTPIKPQQTRSLSNDSNDPSQPKPKRFKGSDSTVNNSLSKKLLKKLNHTDKLTQLLSSPTAPSSLVNNSAFSQSVSTSPQSILERLTPGNVFSPSQQAQQPGRRRSKQSSSGTVKQSKTHRNLPQSDLWALTENSPISAILQKAQPESPKRSQPKEDFENNTNRRVFLQDGSSVLSNSTENINNAVDLDGTNIDDDELADPWQFRPKAGCRYLRPIDQDQQRQRSIPQRSTFSSFFYVSCSEQGHLGKRRVRLGRGGRLLYDRHIEQENKDLTDQTYLTQHMNDKPILWRLSSRPNLKDSYRLHSHLTVEDHTRSLAHHYQSKSSSNTIYFDDASYHVNTIHESPAVSHTGGKYRPSVFSSVELDHSYSCSSRRVNHALRTLAEPQPPSPSSSPSPPLPLSSTNAVSIPQQMILISTPPTPPPLPTMNNHDMDMSPQNSTDQIYTKSSSAFIFSSSMPFFSSHSHSYTISTTPPPASLSSSATTPQTSGISGNNQPSSPISGKSSSTTTPTSSRGRVQLVQLHRIHPSNTPHKFASSTPVTTSDS